MSYKDKEQQIQAAEQAVDAVMQGHALSAMEWTTVFTQCLLGTVMEELDGILWSEGKEDDDDDF